MNSADQNSQPLVYADGYSYTEIFQAPELPGMLGAPRLISVFHAFFAADDEDDTVDASPSSAPAQAQPTEAVSEF